MLKIGPGLIGKLERNDQEGLPVWPVVDKENAPSLLVGDWMVRYRAVRAPSEDRLLFGMSAQC